MFSTSGDLAINSCKNKYIWTHHITQIGFSLMALLNGGTVVKVKQHISIFHASPRSL